MPKAEQVGWLKKTAHPWQAGQYSAIVQPVMGQRPDPLMQVVLLVKRFGPEPLDARRSLMLFGVLPSPPVSSRDLFAPELVRDATKPVLGALIKCRLLEVPSLANLRGRGGSQGGSIGGGATRGKTGASLMLQPASVKTLGANCVRLALLVDLLKLRSPRLALPRRTAEKEGLGRLRFGVGCEL